MLFLRVLPRSEVVFDPFSMLFGGFEEVEAGFLACDSELG